MKSKNKCFALVNWSRLQMKDFRLKEMLSCICKVANGSINEMNNIIDHLTAKRKVYGRTQVYADKHFNAIDLIRDPNGELQLIGYKSDAPLPLKGQHQAHNPKIYRKNDDQVNKTYQNAEERIYNLGEKVRELFPNEDNHFITFALQAIKKYAADRKINADKVISGLEKGRYRLDTNIWRIRPNVRQNESRDKKNKIEYLRQGNGKLWKTDKGEKVPKYCPKCGEKMGLYIQGEPIFKCDKGHYFGTLEFNESKKKHIIVIDESDISRIKNNVEMTEQKFHTNIRRFISQLLQDPVNAQPSYIFKLYGYNRSTLLRYLITSGILLREEHISDKDENGDPKTATMMVKFKCPKKNFDRKLQKLYIRLFEKNLPERHVSLHDSDINEDGEGGCAAALGGATSASSSGQFIQPFGAVQRRKMHTDIEETTSTTSAGNYQYTVPFVGDKETLARKNGNGGSVSVNEI